MMHRLLLLVSLLSLVVACKQQPSADAPEATEPDATLRTAVVDEIEALNAMRSRLALTINEDSVDQGTFARVCKPVGQRAQTIAAERGWAVQQVAEKYRNPANQPDSAAAVVHTRFAENDDLTRLWTRTERNGTTGWRYYRRIVVEPSCMACHGAQEDRPAFIRQNYPDDRAYGFSPGDLRGLYAVFVPDSLRPNATKKN